MTLSPPPDHSKHLECDSWSCSKHIFPYESYAMADEAPLASLSLTHVHYVRCSHQFHRILSRIDGISPSSPTLTKARTQPGACANQLLLSFIYRIPPTRSRTCAPGSRSSRKASVSSTPPSYGRRARPRWPSCSRGSFCARPSISPSSG